MAEFNKTTRIFAPAKINLYLHVTGRRDKGYHALDSLIAFADIGDTVILEPSDQFEFSIGGYFGDSLQGRDRLADFNSTNLVIKAAVMMAQNFDKKLLVHIGLEKNLPLASGLGGGSSDAAAVIWGLVNLWNIQRNDVVLSEILLRLGADVPVCFTAQNSHILGIGEIITPRLHDAELPIVLVNPGKPCLTKTVFQKFDQLFSKPIILPEKFDNAEHFIEFLRLQRNDLEAIACEVVPEIYNVLTSLKMRQGCLLARLSGSGASCFGLFLNEDDAVQAAKTIKSENPDWWVKSGWIGRVARY
jgi:4-diphosphocytidyl-2-C-methyl-D-erythritol kinase